MASTQLASLVDGHLFWPRVAHWFGLTASNIPESVQNSLLNIVMVGVGGYMVGRSGEKIDDKFKGPTRFDFYGIAQRSVRTSLSKEMNKSIVRPELLPSQRRTPKATQSGIANVQDMAALKPVSK